MTELQFSVVSELLRDIRDELAQIRTMQAEAKAKFEEQEALRAQAEAAMRQKVALILRGPQGLPEEKGN